jgi:polysaccharide biosynthesis transport protein
MSQAPLRQYLQVLRRNVLLLVLLPTIAVVSAAALTAAQESIYRTEMKLFVGQVGGGLQPAIGTQPLTQTMTNLLQSEVVTRTAIRRAGVDTTPEKVLRKLTVNVKPDSAVLDVALDWPDQREGAALLGQIATVFTAQVRTKLGLGSNSSGLDSQSSKLLFFTTVFDPPHVLPERVSPRAAVNVGFAGVLGLLLAVTFSFLRETLDDRIRGRRDAETAFEAPVIGALPRGAHRKPLTTVLAGDTDRRGIGDAVRMLRANLRFSRSGVNGPAVLVTSPREGEGKTTVSACVALALALGGKRVLCVDADMRAPKLHRVLGVADSGPGLLDVVQGRATVDDVLQPVDLSAIMGSPLDHSLTNGDGPAGPAVAGSLFLLPAGGPTRDDVMLEAEMVRRLIDSVAGRAEYVIFDSPPLLTNGDAFPLALQVDNVIIAARDGRTTKAGAEATRETLRGLGADRVSVVLTHTGRHQAYPDRSA